MHARAHIAPVVEPFGLVPADADATMGRVLPHSLNTAVVKRTLSGDAMNRATCFREIVDESMHDILDKYPAAFIKTSSRKHLFRQTIEIKRVC